MESYSLSGRTRKAPGAEGDIWFLRMDRAGGEAFQIAGSADAGFQPDNRWIAFTRKTPPARGARDQTAFEKQLDQRFKGKMYDWMNVRFDQRGLSSRSSRSRRYAAVGAVYGRARAGGEAVDAAWRGREWPSPGGRIRARSR